MVTKALKAHSLRDTLSKTVRMLIKDGIEVRFRGHQPYVSARGDKAVLLVLPELNDNASPELLSAIQGYLDHEVGHILYTPFQQHADFAGKSYKRKVMLNIIEDIRLEKLLPRDLPGTKDNLERMYDSAIPVLWAPPCERGVASSDASTRFSSVTIVALRALSGQKAFQKFMDENDYWQHFQPLLTAMPNLSRRLREMESAEDARNMTADILAAIDSIGMLKAVAPPPPPEPDEEETSNTPPNTKSPEQDDSDDSDDGGNDDSDDEDGDDSHALGDDGDDDADSDDANDDAADGGDDSEDGDDEDGDDSDEAGKPGEGDDGDIGGEGPDEDGEGDKGEGDKGEVEESNSKGGGSSDASDQDGDDDSDDDDGEDDDSDQTGGGKTKLNITDALKMLDATQRRAIYMYKQRKLSIEQIAGEMNKTEGEVEDLLRIGRRKLSDLLNGDS